MSERNHSFMSKLPPGILNYEQGRQDKPCQLLYSTTTAQPILASQHVHSLTVTRDPHRWNRSMDQSNQVRRSAPKICSVCQCVTQNRYTCPSCGCPLQTDHSTAPKQPCFDSDSSLSDSEDECRTNHHQQQQQHHMSTLSHREFKTVESEQMIRVPVLQQVRVGLNKYNTQSTVVFREDGVSIAILDGHESVLQIRLTDIRKCLMNACYPVIFVFLTSSSMYEIRKMLHLKVSDFSTSSPVRLKRCISIFPAFDAEERPQTHAMMDSICALIRRYARSTCVIKELGNDDVINLLYDRSLKRLGSISGDTCGTSQAAAAAVLASATMPVIPAAAGSAANERQRSTFTPTSRSPPPPLGITLARGSLTPCDSRRRHIIASSVVEDTVTSGRFSSGKPESTQLSAVKLCQMTSTAASSIAASSTAATSGAGSRRDAWVATLEPAGQNAENKSSCLKRRQLEQSIVPDCVKRRRSVNRQPRDLGRLGELEARPHLTPKQEDSDASHSSQVSRVATSSMADGDIKFVKQKTETKFFKAQTEVHDQEHEQEHASPPVPATEDEDELPPIEVRDPSNPLQLMRVDELDILVVLRSNGSRQTLNFGPLNESVRLLCDRVRVGTLITECLGDVRIRTGLNAGIYFTLNSEQSGTQSVAIYADEIASCHLCVSRCSGISVIFLKPNFAGVGRLCAKLHMITTATDEPALDPTGSSVRRREIVLFVDHISRAQEMALMDMERPRFEKLNELQCLKKLAHIEVDSDDPKAARQFLITNRLTGMSGYEQLVERVSSSVPAVARSAGDVTTDVADELHVTDTEIGILCPYTQRVMKFPVRNINCGHSYERAAVVSYIGHKAGKARCMFVGCPNVVPLRMEDMVDDDELRAYILQNHLSR